MAIDDVENLPLIKADNESGPVYIGAGEATALGLASVFSSGSKAVALAQLDAETLLRHLHLKLHELAKAKARASWFGGRWFNLSVGADMDYIQLSGRHLDQVLTLAGIDLGIPMNPRRAYKLRADVARRSHDALGLHLEVAPDKLAMGL